MPKKQYRKYTFLIKRTKLEPEITFTTVAKDSDEALSRVRDRMQMEVTDMYLIEPKSVGKSIYRKEANVYTNKRVKEIKESNKKASNPGITLFPFPFMHSQTLTSMIGKLKRNANVVK